MGRYITVTRERIFLMILPEHPTYEVARKFQEEVNQKYQLYRVLPTLHITLESFYVESDEDQKRAIGAIQETCRELKPFSIRVNGFACFDPPYKSVQLHVVETLPLTQLYNQIHSRLKEMGYEVMEYPEGVQFHMTIASACFADREWSNEEYQQACEELKSLSVQSVFTFKGLELWYPELEPDARLIHEFELKHFPGQQ